MRTARQSHPSFTCSDFTGAPGVVGPINPLGLGTDDTIIMSPRYLEEAGVKFPDPAKQAGATVSCQQCHKNINLGLPDTLMGRWESAKEACHYWWTWKRIPLLCAACDEANPAF